jgi:16S rRNA (cytosine967-C5)-methyltransferase
MNARKIAFDIIYDAIEKDVKTDEMLSEHSDHRHFNFINNLVSSTVKNLLLLDHIAKEYTKQDLTERPYFRHIFRCFICELYILKTPHHAIFNEWLNIVKKNRKFGTLTGPLNAIMHDLVKKLPSIEDLEIQKTPLSKEKISILYSMPEWIIDEIRDYYSLEEIESIAKLSMETPDTTLRLNTDLAPAAKIKKFLRKDGVEFTDSPFSDDVIYVRRFSKPIQNLSTYIKGFFYIQDEASITFIKSVMPLVKDNTNVLDATCGLGGKITAAYQYSTKTQNMVAWEPNNNKYNMYLQNVNRLQIKGLKQRCTKITKLPLPIKQKHENYFDSIFLDPPCSGWGSLRRKSQAKFSRQPEVVEDLIKLQRKVFASAMKLLKPNGYIFFSLCTLNPKETFENINHFLTEYDNVELVPFPKTSDAIASKFIKDGKYFSPIISETKSDYLFGGILQKKS